MSISSFFRNFWSHLCQCRPVAFFKLTRIWMRCINFRGCQMQIFLSPWLTNLLQTCWWHLLFMVRVHVVERWWQWYYLVRIHSFPLFSVWRIHLVFRNYVRISCPLWIDGTNTLYSSWSCLHLRIRFLSLPDQFSSLESIAVFISSNSLCRVNWSVAYATLRSSSEEDA